MSRYERFNFFSFQWSSSDEETTQGLQCIIRGFGWNEKNESVYVQVQDFLIPIYVELPDHIEWTESRIMMVSNRLLTMNANIKLRPKTICFEQKHRSYYAYVDKIQETAGIKYSHKKFPYLLALFSSVKACESFCGALRGEININSMGKIRLKCHASDRSITPVLKYMAVRELPSAGWMKGRGTRLTKAEKESTRMHEYCISFEDLISMPEEEAIKMPIVLPKIMSFDNEANSTIMSSMPKATRPGDKTFQTGYTMLDPPKQGKPKQYRKYLLSMGHPDPIEGVTIIKYKTEADLYVGFTQKMIEEDPDVVLGFNILGWDINYMIQRCQKFCRCMGEFDRMGCIEGKHAEIGKIKWGSSAYGKQEFSYLDAEGRLFIDMLPYVKRNYKLPNYRLETICDEYLKTNKDPIKPKDIFKAYRLMVASQQSPEDKELQSNASRELSRIGKYCVQDSLVCLLLYEKLNTWYDLVESATTNCTPIFDMFTKGQQIKMASQVYRYCFHNDIVMESNAYQAKDNEHFTGAYVSEPIKGLYDLIVPFDFCLTGDTLITLSNGCSIRLDKMVSGESVLAYNENTLKSYNMIGGIQNKGEKETVKIFFADGTEVVSTPDHKFMITDGTWLEAKDLKNQQVICGLEYPEDIDYNEDWTLPLNDELTLNLKTDRSKALAFARMVGYILADGNIYISREHNRERKCAEVSLSTKVDVEAFIRDLSFFTKKIPNSRLTKADQESERGIQGSVWNMAIPQSVANLVHGLEGIVIGKRSNQPFTWPDFIKDPNCSKVILREFLGGLYGRDGTSPFLTTANTFGRVSFKWTTIEQHLPAMLLAFQQLKDFHERLGVDTSDVLNNRVKYGPTSIKPHDWQTNPRIDVMLIIRIDQTKSFADKIGFRYCVNKNCRLTIAKSYYCLHEKVRIQHDKVLTRTNELIDEKIPNTLARIKREPIFAMCLDQARIQVFKDEPPLHEYSLSSIKDIGIRRGEMKRHPDRTFRLSLQSKKFEKPIEYVARLGVSKWFELKNDLRKVYAVSNEDDSIPVFSKKVIDIRQSGIRPVYDIEVQTAHNFLANGVVAHNCSLYPSIMMAYNIDYSKLVLDPNIPDEDCHVMSWSEHEWCEHDVDPSHQGKKPPKMKDGTTKKVCASFKYRWLKHQVSGKGIIPTLLENLINARKKTRKIIAINEGEIKFLKKILSKEVFNEDNKKDFESRFKSYEENKESISALDIVRNLPVADSTTTQINIIKERIDTLESLNLVLDRRQNAYKINANSMYGATGARVGYLPFLPAAMCVTYMGRTNIKRVNKFIEEKCQGKVIYNDTDSAYCHFVSFRDKPIKELWAHALQIVNDVKRLFPPPVSLDFENKIYKKFLILTKKRYVAESINEEGVTEMEKDGKTSKLLKRGIILQRRDNCTALREVYQSMIYKIFEYHEQLVGIKKSIDKNDIEIANQLAEVSSEISQSWTDTVTELSRIVAASYKPTEMKRYQKKAKDLHKLKVERLEKPARMKQIIYQRDILNHPAVRDLLDMIISAINSVFQWKYGFKNFVITKQITRDVKDYKNPNKLQGHVLLGEKMKSRGIPVGAGSRIEYVIIKNKVFKKTDAQKDKLEDVNYFAEHREIYRLDYLSYLKQFINPIDELCEVVMNVKGFVKGQFEQRIQYSKVVDRITMLGGPKIKFEKVVMNDYIEFNDELEIIT